MFLRQSDGLVKKLRSLAGLAALALCACGSPANAGGVYMARASDHASLFQIVESPDGTVSGSVVVVDVSATGELISNQYDLVGANDGNLLHITVKTGLFGIGDASLLAELRGGGFRVASQSDVGISPATYVRASMGKFEAAVADLRKLATQRSAEHKEGERVRRLARRIEQATTQFEWLTQGAQDFLEADQNVSVYRERVEAAYADIEDRMSAISEKMTATHDGYAVGSMSYAIGSLDYDASSLDSEVRRAMSNHRREAEALRRTLGEFEGDCDISHYGNAGKVADELKRKWQNACDGFAVVYVDLHVALGRVDSVELEFEKLMAHAATSREVYSGL